MIMEKDRVYGIIDTWGKMVLKERYSSLTLFTLKHFLHGFQVENFSLQGQN